MKEYIFFDFNGTLLDDVDLCFSLLNQMLTKKNYPIITKKRYVDIFTFPVIEYYKKAGFHFPEDDFPTLAAFFMKHYQNENHNCQLYPDVRTVLQTLKTQGKHLIILSASEKELLQQQCRFYQIEDFFDHIIGCDSIHAKGKVEQAMEFAKNHSFPKEKAVFIGDTLHDEEVALALGIDSILVARGHQSNAVLSRGHAKIVNSLIECIPLFDSL